MIKDYGISYWCLWKYPKKWSTYFPCPLQELEFMAFIRCAWSTWSCTNVFDIVGSTILTYDSQNLHDLDVSFCISTPPECEWQQGPSSRVIHTYRKQISQCSVRGVCKKLKYSFLPSWLGKIACFYCFTIRMCYLSHPEQKKKVQFQINHDRRNNMIYIGSV